VWPLTLQKKAVLESLQKAISTNEIEYEYIRQTDSTLKGEEILVQEALARLEIKEQRIKEAYENEVDTLEEYKQNKLRLKAERETLLADAERLRQQASQTPEEVPSKAEVMRRITNIYELISNPDVDNETKGNALRSVVKKIVFDRKLGRFSFHYYIS